MFAIVQNDQIIKIIQPHTEFDINGQHYTAKWTARMSAEDRAALGIQEVVSDPEPDQRFYWVEANPVTLVDGQPRITYTSRPKQLEDITVTPESGEPYTQPGLKTQWIQQTKTTANRRLADTDWMVIRKAERGIAIPADVLTNRAQIIADCAAQEAAISAATTVAELIAAVDH